MTRQTGVTFAASSAGTLSSAGAPLPPIGPPCPIALPPMADVRTAEGLRIIAARHASVPMAEVRLLVPLRAATAHDVAVQEVLANTLLPGTRDLGDGTLLDELEAAGATLSVSRSARWLGLAGTGPATALPRQLLLLLNKVLTRSSHRDRTVTAVRERTRAQAVSTRSQPQLLASEALLDHLYGPLPQLQDVPFEADLAGVTTPQVRQAHLQWLRPKGTTLLLVGDLDPEQAVADAVRALAPWLDSSRSSTGGRGSLEPERPPRRRTGVAWIRRPGATQSQIRLAAVCPDRDDPEFPAVTLANLVFGGYFSSRLVADVRERHGLAYRCDSLFRDHLDQLVVSVEADTATARTASTLERITTLLGQLTEQPPTSGEIEAARRYVTGMTALAVSSQQGWATSLALAVTTGRQPQHIPLILEEFAAVTDREVAAATRHYLPEHFAGVVVGDSEHHHEKGRPQ